MRLPVLLGLLACACAASGFADDIGKKFVDPVNKKAVTVAKETPSVALYGETLYFSDAASRTAFLKAPETYLKTPVECPVRNIKGRPNKLNRLVVNDQILYFCCAGCAEGFRKEPNNYLPKVTDPVSKKAFELFAEAPKAEHKGTLYFFENDKNKAEFEKEPGKYAGVVLQ